MGTAEPDRRALNRRAAVVPGSVAVALPLAALVLAALAWAAVPLPQTRAVARPPGCAERVQQRLYFGLTGPAGPVPDAAWDAFVADEITPRFPAGLTVVSASGQWRGADHRVVSEQSRVVEIVHDGSAALDLGVAEIVALYKRRFKQDSVMVARTRVEVCF